MGMEDVEVKIKQVQVPISATGSAFCGAAEEEPPGL